jgi:hypothetical protein
MYNLFVSSNADDWNGEPWTIELSRCVQEYTDKTIIARFGSLDDAAIDALKQLPCIFAYEAANMLAPKFGTIREITKRYGEVKVAYEILPVERFLDPQDFERPPFELGIGKWEMNRTHWAVKDVDLQKELKSRGITLPALKTESPREISEVTRRDIIEKLTVAGGVDWSGRLEDGEFLGRLYDLSKLPSNDLRYNTAADDIWQHTVNNPGDWPRNWVFQDKRFKLLDGPDREFLRFLCETVHPVVRHSDKEARELGITLW